MIKRFLTRGVSPRSRRGKSLRHLMRVISAQRIRLLRVARKKATPMSDLAVGLKRDTRAVGRDVDLLERFGLLRTRYEKNPGHGKRTVVESRAAKYQLIATI